MICFLLLSLLLLCDRRCCCSAAAATAAVFGFDFYRWPVDTDGSLRFIRHTAVQFSGHPSFTLPFSDTAVKMTGAWRYGNLGYHHALDFSNGTPSFQVRSMAAGVVKFVGWDNWSGNTVVVSHAGDTWRTIYSKLLPLCAAGGYEMNGHVRLALFCTMLPMSLTRHPTQSAARQSHHLHMTVQPLTVHLRNGKTNDCAKGKANSLANLTPGSQSYIDYNTYLINSGCKKTVPAPGTEYWGSDTQTIPVAVGQSVVRGQVIAWAGNTGPGGKRGASLSANTHLHLFTTRKVRPRSAATFGSHRHRSLALASMHALSATIQADILLVAHVSAGLNGRPVVLHRPVWHLCPAGLLPVRHHGQDQRALRTIPTVMAERPPGVSLIAGHVQRNELCSRPNSV